MQFLRVAGTLWQAILDANALPAGPHTIQFVIGSGVHAIALFGAAGRAG